MKCIASVQHTGTWFTFDIINKFCGIHPKILKDVVGIAPETGFHWSSQYIGNHTFKPVIKELDCEYFHFHLGRGSQIETWLPTFIANAMISTYDTVIPIRDPVMSIITRQHRHPNLKHHHIVDGFEQVAKHYYERTPGVHYFRIDTSDRKSELKGLLDFLQVENYDQSRFDQYASTWSKQNYKPNRTNLKSLYKQNKYDDMKKLIGYELGLLFDNKLIKSMLLDMGYEMEWLK